MSKHQLERDFQQFPLVGCYRGYIDSAHWHIGTGLSKVVVEPVKLQQCFGCQPGILLLWHLERSDLIRCCALALEWRRRVRQGAAPRLGDLAGARANAHDDARTPRAHAS